MYVPSEEELDSFDPLLTLLDRCESAVKTKLSKWDCEKPTVLESGEWLP